jgi:Zn-dependent peptidase ImmA (M78 family)
MTTSISRRTLTVRYGDPGGDAWALYDPDTCEIVIDKKTDDAEAIQSLFHEIVHYLFDDDCPAEDGSGTMLDERLHGFIDDFARSTASLLAILRPVPA